MRMDQFVVNLGLPDRVCRVLKKNGIVTVFALVSMTEAELLRYNRLGKKTLAEINGILKLHGGYVGMVSRLSTRPYKFCKCCKVYHKEAA